MEEWLSSIKVDPLLLLLVFLALIAYNFWKWSVTGPAESREKDGLPNLQDIIEESLTDRRKDEEMWARDVGEPPPSDGGHQEKELPRDKGAETMYPVVHWDDEYRDLADGDPDSAEPGHEVQQGNWLRHANRARFRRARERRKLRK